MTLPIKALGPAFLVASLSLVEGNLRAGITTVGPVLDQIRDDNALARALAAGLISLSLLVFAIVSRSSRRSRSGWGLSALSMQVSASSRSARCSPLSRASRRCRWKSRTLQRSPKPAACEHQRRRRAERVLLRTFLLAV